MQIIGLYGGAFDPPHVGHLMVAMWASVTGFVDKIWIIPAYKHVFEKQMTSFDHRLNMCKEAFSIFENVQIKQDEKDWVLNGGSGYTIDFLNHLKTIYPETDYSFRAIIGSDNWQNRAKWKNWQELAKIADPLVVGRSGYDNAGFVEVCDVSSTEIRKCLLEGDGYQVGPNKVPIAYTLPLPVLTYIYEKGLYGTEARNV